MGPTLPTQDVYLRTAVAVGREGWANFAHVKHAGVPVGHLPGRARSRTERIALRRAQGRAVPGSRCPASTGPSLQRLIVVQGDTEPASVEQQRNSAPTAPSLYDLRNLFQVNVEEGRHLWAMVYLLHAYFGRDGPRGGRGAAAAQLRQRGLAAHPRRVQRGDPGLAVVLHVHLLHRPGRQVPARHAQESAFDPLCAHLRVHAEGRGAPHVRRAPPAWTGWWSAPPSSCVSTTPTTWQPLGGIPLAGHPEVPELPLQRQPRPVRRRDLHQRGELLHRRAEGPLAGGTRRDDHVLTEAVTAVEQIDGDRIVAAERARADRAQHTICARPTSPTARPGSPGGTASWPATG